MTAPYSKLTQGFLTHWQSLRVDGQIPTAAAFFDRADPLFIPHVVMLDVGSDRIDVRFVGTALAARRQRDATGKIWGEDYDPAIRQRLAEAATTIATHPCGLWQVQRMKTNLDRLLEMEAIVLPVAAPAGQSPRVVGYSQTWDALGREESTSRFHDVQSAEWIDIGFGVPLVPKLIGHPAR